MPRRNQPSRRAAKRESDSGFSVAPNQRIEQWRGQPYVVRSLSGSSASGPYRCPGCDQSLPAATPHIVAWPEHDSDAEYRRHWHTPCWAARDRRTPGVQRSRNGPRY